MNDYSDREPEKNEMPSVPFDVVTGCLHCLIMEVMQAKKEAHDHLRAAGLTPPSALISIEQLMKATAEVTVILQRDDINREDHKKFLMTAFGVALDLAHLKIDARKKEHTAAPDLVGKPVAGSA